MISFLSQFKIYFIVGTILLFTILGWKLKASIEENAIKDLQIQALVDGTKALEELHKKEIAISIFNTKVKAKKEEIEKTFIRRKNENQDTLDYDNIYFSL